MEVTGTLWQPKVVAVLKICNISVNIYEGTKLPNRFQRYMLKKVFGISITILDED